MAFIQSFGGTTTTDDFKSPVINTDKGPRRMNRAYINTAITKRIYVRYMDRQGTVFPGTMLVFEDKQQAVNFFKALTEHIERNF